MCVSAHTDKHLLLWTPTSQLDKSLFITLKYCSFSYGKESSFKLNYLLCQLQLKLIVTCMYSQQNCGHLCGWG